MASAAQVFRPAPLPDNKRLLWYPLAIGTGLAGLGIFLGSLPLMFLSVIIVVVVFPGIPIAIHCLYFLSIKITVNGDRLIVMD